MSALSPERKSSAPAGALRAARPTDAAAILRIYGPFVADTAVSFETAVPTEAEMRERIETYASHAPWLVYETDGKVVGYAYASKHRAREGYRWTVEVSAYVDPAFHRQGIARLLYTELLAALETQGFRQALAGIALPNEASERFHESLGFSAVGVYRNIGYKLGRWHDVGWWQRPLGEPGEQ
jgi:L-amino acid N-acyltransferase YncA